MGRPKSEFNIPSSYSADYFQRGKDYAEKLRRGFAFSFLFVSPPISAWVRVLINFLNHAEHPELYKDKGGPQADGERPKPSTSNNNATDSGNTRQAATDQIMMERFRKRERNRVMRR